MILHILGFSSRFKKQREALGRSAVARRPSYCGGVAVATRARFPGVAKGLCPWPYGPSVAGVAV